MKFKSKTLVVGIACAAFAAPLFAQEGELERETEELGQEVEQAGEEAADESREVSQESESTLEEWQGEAYDAWIDGKLEASYLINTELNNFDISTDVDNGNVILTGNVSNETEKQLAGEIAQNLEGVVNVDNQLAIVPEEAEAESETDVAAADTEAEAEAGAEADERDFSTRFWDLTTTARLKSSFAINDELEATEIGIDTLNGVVTLEGEVDSEAKKQLAEEIAAGYDHVVRVENNLTVTTEESVAEESVGVDDPQA